MPTTSQRGYATNIASEFYVLSILYRLGLDAYLTLGNRKGIDIVVACGPGRAMTIEVKAVAGRDDWLVGSLGLAPREHHYVVLLSFEGRFGDPQERPNAWVFAHDEIVPFIKDAKTGTARYISRKQVREAATAHLDAWATLRDAAV